MEIGIVVGTRPEIIKMAPVIRAAEAADAFEPYLVHTNQHYDEELSEVFFENLELPAPDENLNVESGTQGGQTAAGLVGVERLLTQREPAAVLAQGDTNAVLSTALAASKLPVAFGHVEAGIRSFDRSMPEEVNRVVADAVSDYLFAPTDTAATNLADESVHGEVVVSGNTVVDACREHTVIADERSDVLEEFGLTPDEYVVATIHRPQNTDDPARLRRIMDELGETGLPVVFPAHPRTRAALDEIGYAPPERIRLVDPLDYLDFLRLESNARVIVTDSGGLQEEASILEVPCLTVRPNTERPETIEAGVNELCEPADVGERLRRVYEDDAVHDAMTGHPGLYGDGDAGEQIVAVLADRLF